MLPQRFEYKFRHYPTTLFTKKLDNSCQNTPGKCAFWSNKNRVKTNRLMKLSVGFEFNTVKLNKQKMSASLTDLSFNCLSQRSAHWAERCRCEAEHFTMQPHRSSAPSDQAFSHASVNTPGTEVTDMCTFLNNLASASDGGLVFIWQAGLNHKTERHLLNYRSCQKKNTFIWQRRFLWL